MFEIKFYLGVDFDKHNKAIENKYQLLQNVRDFIGRQYGGFTEYKAQGSWFNQDKGLTVCESCKVFEVVVNEPLTGEKETETAEYLKQVLNQSSVLVTSKPLNLLEFI